jgi:hypothetical protein
MRLTTVEASVAGATESEFLTTSDSCQAEFGFSALPWPAVPCHQMSALAECRGQGRESSLGIGVLS